MRPDPAAGVFETVLVEGGVALHLDAHLARLTASVSALYGAQLDPGAFERAWGAAEAAGERSRLRILASADGLVEIAVSPAPETGPEPVVLVPYEVPGGLGAHKWRDRRLVDELTHREPGTVPLLVDSDGSVLEASYANVWIVEGQAPITPPADGRILPGITRARLLAAEPSAREEVIDVERFARAERLFVTSSISGLREARMRR
jgi:para-aminobenzoate synthetase / 4-amino-4-deoxychorismate lyase